jgi:2-succinyl-5-enolpyruvyl-6-hydroxy-3-cyclohexene-1-carboxylate synthase
MSTQATCCATLVDEWVRGGVRHAVASPGSRSTPLVLAIAARPEISLSVVLDERSAAFVALGLGKATGRPAIVVCTSGTAAANHHPAVIEADLSSVPLLVCTADRPPELHDVGAPQTIEQVGLFAGSVRWSVDLDPLAFAASSWRSVAARAMADACDGPVHVNIRLREPLLEEVDDLPPGRAHGHPWHRVESGERLWDPDDEVLAEIDGRRLVVVAGAGADVGGTGWLERAPWPVLADALSGLRRPRPMVVGAFDAIVRAADGVSELAPEVVLHLGGPPASKVLGQWLDRLDATHIVVGRGRHWLDPSRAAAIRIEATPASVASALLTLTTAPAGHVAAWADAEAAAQSAFDTVLSGHPEVTEPGVARNLVRALPDDAALVVSSSMPVRDVEWFGAPRDGLRILANRGANGIDGVTSTALGVALADPSQSVAALVGDLALLHDGGGLAGIADRGCSLTLVVVDNQGGGIFSFLPQAEALAHERFEQLFGTPQRVDLQQLCTAHAIPSVRMREQSDLEPLLAESRSHGGVRVIIAPTDREANVAVHRELNDAVAARMTT